jgi:hypothetical protein
VNERRNTVKNAKQFANVAKILELVSIAPPENFDTLVLHIILALDNARAVESEAREWAEMFDGDSPFRSDLIDIAIIAERMA